jgi:hypothetical protein
VGAGGTDRVKRNEADIIRESEDFANELIGIRHIINTRRQMWK